MSDPMMNDPMQDKLSTLNPVDMASMQQMKGAGQGPLAGITPETPIREFFEKMGIDVEGPVSQLKQFADKEIANGDPLNKAKSMAGPMPPGGGPGGSPMPDMPPGAPPPGGGGNPGLEGLMQ